VHHCEPHADHSQDRCLDGEVHQCGCPRRAVGAEDGQRESERPPDEHGRDPPPTDGEEVHGEDDRHAEEDHGEHQRGQGARGGRIRVVEHQLEQHLGCGHGDHEQEERRDRKEHEHDRELAQRVPALAPSDGCFR